MAEARLDAYGNAAGLLRRMGYEARAVDGWKPPSWMPDSGGRPVAALVTCAPPVVAGYAVAITAEDPEAHLPQHSAKAARANPSKPGDPQLAWWADGP